MLKAVQQLHLFGDLRSSLKVNVSYNGRQGGMFTKTVCLKILEPRQAGPSATIPVVVVIWCHRVCLQMKKTEKEMA